MIFWTKIPLAGSKNFAGTATLAEVCGLQVLQIICSLSMTAERDHIEKENTCIRRIHTHIHVNVNSKYRQYFNPSSAIALFLWTEHFLRALYEQNVMLCGLVIENVLCRIECPVVCYSDLHNKTKMTGWTENAGPENGGPKKMKELKIQYWKWRTWKCRTKKPGPENGGPTARSWLWNVISRQLW